MSETLSKESIVEMIRAKFEANSEPDMQVWYSEWAETWWIVASLPPKAPVHGYYKPNDPNTSLDQTLATIAFRAKMMPNPVPPIS